MNGPKKIMTVSYGAFSCTLEGFDDPFNILQQVTAHFRDIAASDPAFGADPAPPAPRADDNPVDRLIREADSQMNEPRNQRRQSAIRHLRAAVAANVAERLDPTPTGPTKRIEPAPASTGFGAFAEKLGAETPPELVEAAAVWSLRMEGRPLFTRPQVFRHVASLAAMTHEAMVEAFDTLLHSAVLERQGRDRYALTERSSFLRDTQG